MLQQNIYIKLYIAFVAMLLLNAGGAEACEIYSCGRTIPPAKSEEFGEQTADMRFMIKSVTLPGQVKLQYVEQGNSTGIPVLLLHGYTDSWHSFELVLPHLPKSIHAFALSQRGHGDSERPATGYRPQDFAADVAAFMDALKLDRAIIVGHSLGSYVAQAVAINYPDRILGLVLAGSFTTLRGDAGIQEFWQTAISKLEDPIDPGFALEFQKSTLAQPVPERYLDTVVQESLKVPAFVWKAALQGAMESDFSSELGQIKAPTLIVWGDKDTYFPREKQDALVAGIAAAQLVVYSGAGHGLHWEEPQRFAVEIGAFAKKFKN